MHTPVNRIRINSSYAMFIASMLIFGTIGIFRRFLDIPSAMLAFCRGIIGSIALLIVFLLRKNKEGFHLSQKLLLLLLVSGAFIGLNWILLFEAYRYTTIATATLCYYLEPTIVVLLAPLFFHEKLTLRKGICVACALLGMVLISGILQNGIPQREEALGILCGIGAAILYASVVIMNKVIPHVDAYMKTMLQLASAAVVILPYLMVSDSFAVVNWDLRTVVILLVVGIVHTGLAYAMYFKSVEELPGQTIAIGSYIDPVSALILSALFLQEKMTVWGILGAIMIIGSAIIMDFQPKTKNPQ